MGFLKIALITWATLLIISNQLGVDGCKFGPNWVSSGNGKYFRVDLSQVLFNGLKALQRCNKTNGGTLATVHSAPELELIASLGTTFFMSPVYSESGQPSLKIKLCSEDHMCNVLPSLFYTDNSSFPMKTGDVFERAAAKFNNTIMNPSHLLPCALLKPRKKFFVQFFNKECKDRKNRVLCQRTCAKVDRPCRVDQRPKGVAKGGLQEDYPYFR